MDSIFGPDDGEDDLLRDPDGDIGEDENDGEGMLAADDDEKGIKVEPKKRTVRNPRPKLGIEILCGSRGIHTIEDYFKDIKFRGKGYEKDDLNEILRRMQHWAHRMYPRYTFDDVLETVDRLSKKKPLQVHMSRYRLGLLEGLKLVEQQGVVDEYDNAEGDAPNDEPFDDFDALLGEQIAISKLAPRTPGTNKNNQHSFDHLLSLNTSASTIPCNTSITERRDDGHASITVAEEQKERLSPAPASSEESQKRKLSAEQLDRIAENRRLAQERLRANRNRAQQVTE